MRFILEKMRFLISLLDIDQDGDIDLADALLGLEFIGAINPYLSAAILDAEALFTGRQEGSLKMEHVRKYLTIAMGKGAAVLLERYWPRIEALVTEQIAVWNERGWPHDEDS